MRLVGVLMATMVLALNACAFSRGTLGDELKAETINLIKKGTTTRSEVLALLGAPDRLLQESQLLVEHGSSFLRCDAQQILDCGHQPSADLRRFGSGETDLIEGEVDVVVPSHRRHCHPQSAIPIPSVAIDYHPPRELTQPVVQTVDRLNRGRRVEEG